VRSNLRNLLLDLFRQGLTAVNGRSVVYAWLQAHPPKDGFYLVALGKAADAMTAGALDAAAPILRTGLVVTRYGFLDTPAYRDPRIVSLEAGHPLPDAQSLAAGRALQLFLKDAPADAEFLFLVSGGASSTVEVPVAGVNLETLQQLNTWLLGSGLPISDINQVRAALSRIKGGRLAQQLEGRRATLLLISDVPGDVVADIGSGLLLPSPVKALPKLPARFAELPFQEDPVPASANVETHIVASNGMAREAVADAARAIGVQAHVHASLPAEDAVTCGSAMAEILLEASSGVHIWGGETTVILSENPGQGGRCQQLALAAARGIAGYADILLLAAGTDGADGVTDDAGALVDGGSVARGEDGGYDAKDCIARADAGAFLEASGDLIHTGPTGSNVTDIIIAYKA
jgi:glycerate 2-kinase